ncbi:hypothetical protein E2562_029957 [Oryza meyeriana var. granulata]|uniref:Uncharacterized protein n=1 Tax=Oryza meyeriana var. granulata TaxID=110450 RepID=A0A6G1CUP3_9ORYZ|nr:hypothetical protein E2562_029957 [Oryza meyeriana var. granulata]
MLPAPSDSLSHSMATAARNPSSGSELPRGGGSSHGRSLAVSRGGKPNEWTGQGRRGRNRPGRALIAPVRWIRAVGFVGWGTWTVEIGGFRRRQGVRAQSTDQVGCSPTDQLMPTGTPWQVAFICAVWQMKVASLGAQHGHAW